MPRVSGGESNRKQWCLTYPQFNLAPQEFIDWLKTREAEDQTIDEYFVQQEEHAASDGEGNHGLHLHVYVKLSKGFGKSSPAALLFFNHPSRTAHVSRDWNGQKPGKSWVWNYLLRKDKPGVLGHVTSVSIEYFSL